MRLGRTQAVEIGFTSVALRTVADRLPSAQAINIDGAPYRLIGGYPCGHRHRWKARSTSLPLSRLEGEYPVDTPLGTKSLWVVRHSVRVRRLGSTHRAGRVGLRRPAPGPALFGRSSGFRHPPSLSGELGGMGRVQSPFSCPLNLARWGPDCGKGWAGAGAGSGRRAPARPAQMLSCGGGRSPLDSTRFQTHGRWV